MLEFQKLQKVPLETYGNGVATISKLSQNQRLIRSHSEPFPETGEYFIAFTKENSKLHSDRMSRTMRGCLAFSKEPLLISEYRLQPPKAAKTNNSTVCSPLRAELAHATFRSQGIRALSFHTDKKAYLVLSSEDLLPSPLPKSPSLEQFSEEDLFQILSLKLNTPKDRRMKAYEQRERYWWARQDPKFLLSLLKIPPELITEFKLAPLTLDIASMRHNDLLANDDLGAADLGMLYLREAGAYSSKRVHPRISASKALQIFQELIVHSSQNPYCPTFWQSIHSTFLAPQPGRYETAASKLQ